VAPVSPRVLTTAPFIVVGVFFLATRLTLLGRFPPFLDESLYATWALRVHDSVNDRFVALAYGKLPLLSWLSAGFVFLGVEPLDAVRLVSIAAGATSLVLAGLLAKRLGGTSSGILAAAIYGVLPLAFVHDVIGVMEPLVAALLVAALYLQMRLAERPNGRRHSCSASCWAAVSSRRRRARSRFCFSRRPYSCSTGVPKGACGDSRCGWGALSQRWCSPAWRISS
jgi:4-amino-4-deoxy-L-arabinose transferase-like glycosyltransferase